MPASLCDVIYGSGYSVGIVTHTLINILTRQQDPVLVRDAIMHASCCCLKVGSCNGLMQMQWGRRDLWSIFMSEENCHVPCCNIKCEQRWDLCTENCHVGEWGVSHSWSKQRFSIVSKKQGNMSVFSELLNCLSMAITTPFLNWFLCKLPFSH